MAGETGGARVHLRPQYLLDKLILNQIDRFYYCLYPKRFRHSASTATVIRRGDGAGILKSV